MASHLSAPVEDGFEGDALRHQLDLAFCVDLGVPQVGVIGSGRVNQDDMASVQIKSTSVFRTVETRGGSGASNEVLGSDAMSGLGSQHRIDH